MRASDVRKAKRFNVGLRLSPEDFQHLQRLSQATDRPVAQVLRRLVRTARVEGRDLVAGSVQEVLSVG